MNDRIPKVLVVLPTANQTQRCILEGVLNYAHAHGPWQFHLITGDAEEQGLARAREWGCTGLIALSSTARNYTRLAALRVPSVFINPPPEVGGRPSSRRIVFVRRDNRNIGKSAAEYFLTRGFRNFAFVGAVHPSLWNDEREAGFCEELARHGCVCRCYPTPTRAEQADFALEGKRLGSWLAVLPRPTALFTVKDMRGQQVLSVCMDRKLRVPEDVAVLSTDNDAILCETATPALSSIALDGEGTGAQCAQILESLMQGRRREPLVDLAFPRIVTRRSTEAFAVADPILARALEQISHQLSEKVRLGRLAADLGVSARTLEMKAQRTFGHSLREEVLRLRLNLAVRELSNTTMTVQEVALRCGFCDASHLGRAVRKAFGYSPRVFRAEG